MIYFTADTHFGSERTLELSKRPFKSVEEMDQYMITEWNKLINPYDTVWHLGDFGNYEICKKLNGNIRLIRGNYEVKDGLTESDAYNYGFKSLSDASLIDLPVEKNSLNVMSLYLCHEPSKCIKSSSELMNLFGHIHGRQKVKRFGLDVGVDGHHFKPISEDDVRFYINAIKNHYDDEVFMS